MKLISAIVKNVKNNKILLVETIHKLMLKIVYSE